MPIYDFRRRVACYVTRGIGQEIELLVFEHVEGDPAVPSGLQVPAGGMLPFEGIEAAAHREVAEESGLTGLVYRAQLGGIERGLDEPGGPSMTTFVHLEAPSDTPDQWRHLVTGDGADAGMWFDFRWERLPLSGSLSGEQGQYLDRVTATT